MMPTIVIVKPMSAAARNSSSAGLRDPVRIPELTTRQAIVKQLIVSNHLGYGRPIAGFKVLPHALVHLGCRIIERGS